jgi:uncharacterized protein (TIGR02246 family)
MQTSATETARSRLTPPLPSSTTAVNGRRIRVDLCDGNVMNESPEHLHVRFRDAFNRHDLDAVVALYEHGAVLVTAHGPTLGHDAIREAYRGSFAGRPAIELETLAVHRAGDLAMLHGRWRIERTSTAGEPTRYEGRNTETVRLQPDGHWLFVIDDPSGP